jgi:hypothetical protein
MFAGADQERYPESSTQDRDVWLVGIEASRRITQRIQALIKASYEERTFEGTSSDDRTTTLSLGADWRLGRTLFLGFEAGTEQRSGNTTFFEYDETFGQVSLSYRPAAQE